MFKKKSNSKKLCLDFGFNTAKFFVFDFNGDKIELVNFRKVSVLDDDGHPLEIDKLVKKFGEALKAVGGFKLPLYISFSGREALVRYLEVPKMEEADFKSSIKYQAESYVPIPLDDVYFDGAILTEPEEGSAMMKIVFVAAKQKTVNFIMSITSQLGISPVRIEPASISLLNAVKFLNPAVYNNKVAAVIDMGAENLNTNIVARGLPALSRENSLGNRSINDNLIKGINCSFAESEDIKLKRDINVGRYMIQYLNSVFQEIRSSFNFFQGDLGENITHVFLCGGSAFMQESADYIQSMINIETIDLETFARNKVNFNTHHFKPADLDNISIIAGIGLGAGDIVNDKN